MTLSKSLWDGFARRVVFGDDADELVQARSRRPSSTWHTAPLTRPCRFAGGAAVRCGHHWLRDPIPPHGERPRARPCARIDSHAVLAAGRARRGVCGGCARRTGSTHRGGVCHTRCRDRSHHGRPGAFVLATLRGCCCCSVVARRGGRYVHHCRRRGSSIWHRDCCARGWRHPAEPAESATAAA